MKTLDTQITYDQLDLFLDAVQEFVDPQQHDVYVFSYGSHTKDLFLKLRDDEDLEVEWNDTVFPFGLRWLQMFIASHGGLVKVKEKKKIKTTFIPMSDLAFVDLLVAEAGLAANLEKRIKKERSDFSFESILATGKAFLFRMDGDSFEEAMPAALHCSDSFAKSVSKFWKENIKSNQSSLTTPEATPPTS